MIIDEKKLNIVNHYKNSNENMRYHYTLTRMTKIFKN